MIQAKLQLNRFLVLLIVLLAIETVVVTDIYYQTTKHKIVIKEIPTLYKVVEIIDGDTIAVEMNNKNETVRLLGIDSPETENPYKPVECFGDKSTQKAKELLEEQEIYLIPDPLSSDRGIYDRLLRYIFLQDGTLVNAVLIKEGYAFNYIYEPFQFMKYFDYLEKQAKEDRLGLWSEECDYYFEVGE